MAPVLTTPAEQIDTVGEQSMGVQIEALNANSYEAENLPTGFRVNSETGKITGLGPEQQTRAVKVTAKGSTGEASAEFIWKVVPDVTAISLPDKTSRKNEPIHLKLAVPGAGEYQAEGLPPGLSINTSTGEITGAPTTFGSYDVTVKVKNEAVANNRGTLAIAWGSKGAAGLAGGYYAEGSGIAIPEYVRGIQDITQVEVGANQVYALKKDKSVWVAGPSVTGQLGRGRNRYNNLVLSAVEPLEVPGLENKVMALSVATNGVFCLMENKTVKAWGPNQGQLGIGQEGGAIAKYRPIQVEASKGVPFTNVKMLAAGHYNCVFVKTDNTVWRSGQKNSQSTYVYPTQVNEFNGLAEITAVASSFENTMLLLADGTIRVKGRNQYGQLGNGKDEDQEKEEGKSTPEIVAQVSKPTLPEKAIAIALNEDALYVLLESGKVMAWGRNNRGQQGNGEISTEIHVKTPATIAGLENVAAIAAGGGLGASGAIGGGSYAGVLLENSTVMMWGAGGEGQCGDGTQGTKLKPVAVIGGFTGITALALGESHAMALIESATARAKPSIEAVAGINKINVTWRNMPSNRSRTEKWEIKYRRLEENPETSKPETLKVVTAPNKEEAEETLELKGLFPLAKPASTPEWLHPGNIIETQVVSRLKIARPTVTIAETSAKHYRFTWPLENNEPGWFLEWRRTEEYVSMVVQAGKVYEAKSDHISTESFVESKWIELPGHSQVGIPAWAGKTKYEKKQQEPFKQPGPTSASIEVTGSEYNAELPDYEPAGVTIPATLKGTAIEAEIEGSYLDPYRNRWVWSTPLNSSGELEAEIPQEVEPCWLTVGIVKPGDKLTILKAAEWTNSPTSFTRQWYRKTSEEKDPLEPIVGETGTEYTVRAEDVGYEIRLGEIATNAVGEAVTEALSGTTRLVEA